MRIRRIQATLIRAFALIVIMTIFLLGAVSLNFFRRTLVDSAEQSTMQFAAQLSRIVDNYIAYMNDIALVVMDDQDVRAYMAAPAASSAWDRARIESFLGSIRKVRKDIDGVFLLPARSNAVGAAPDVLPAYVIARRPATASIRITITATSLRPGPGRQIPTYPPFPPPMSRIWSTVATPG